MPSLTFARVHPFVGVGAGRTGNNKTTYSGFIGNLSAGLVKNGLGLEFGLSHFQQETKLSPQVRDGELILMPISVDLIVNPKIGKNTYLIARGGISYYFSERSLKDDDVLAASWNGWKVREEIKGRMGYQFGGGLQFRISSRARIGFEVMQRIYHPETVFTRVDTKILTNNVMKETKSIDLSQIIGVITFKWVW